MEPFINLEEQIGKTVGRRRPPHPLSLHGQTKEAARAWQQAFPFRGIPRGVYRFKTHEEADAWMLKMISRPPKGELVSREPSVEDLLELCRELNAQGARYVVVGGFAIRAAGYMRRTMDVDIIVATDLENEARVFKALESLPDQAVLELEPGEVEKWGVVRVSDEILVDLMASACGIKYEEAAQDVVWHKIDGTPIPFASPRLLWRMKAPIQRAKDQGDLYFLREYFRQRGEEPPAIS